MKQAALDAMKKKYDEGCDVDKEMASVWNKEIRKLVQMIKSKKPFAHTKKCDLKKKKNKLELSKSLAEWIKKENTK